MLLTNLRKLLDRGLKLVRRLQGQAASSSRRKTSRLTVEPLETRLAPANLLSFEGMNATQAGGHEPPDTILAVSSTNVIEATNTAYEVFNKNGSVSVGVTSFQTLFSSIFHGAGYSFTDPYVVYDELTRRFVMGALEYNPAAGYSFYDLAVSGDGTAASWSFFQVDVSERNYTGPGGSGPFLADFPKLGFNADELVATFNQIPFSSPNGPIGHILVLSLNASQLFNGTLSYYLNDQALLGQDATLFPAQMHGASAGNPMFFAESGTANNAGNSLFVVSATNLLSTTPSFTNNQIAVDAYQEPPAVPNVTSAIDARIVSVDWRNGHLVAAHTIGQSSDALDHARWYEFLAPVSGSPSLLQDGTVQNLNARNTFYPSIAINTAGGLGLNYLEIGGDLNYMAMAVTGRVPSDTRGFMAAGTFVHRGDVKYAGTRAGDYSGTVMDPVDGTFWAANEYASGATGGYWGTAIDHFTKPVEELYPYASGHDGSGDPEEFVIGLDNQVYNVKFNSAGNPVTGYSTTPIATGQVKSISVSSDGSGNPLLFAIGMDNQVYSVKFNSSGDPTTGLVLTTSGEAETISPGRDGSNNPELFAVGVDDQVYDQKFNSSGTSLGGYTLTTSGTVEALTVGHYGSPASPEDFVIGLDSQAYYVKFNASGDAITGYALVASGQVKALSVGYDGSGNIELFTINSDSQVYYVHFNSSGAPTTGYTLTASGQVNAIAVGSDGSGDPELFVIGLDDQVYSMKFNSAGSPTTGYVLTQAGKVKALTVSSYGSGTPELFVIGSDDQVYDQLFNSSGNSISLYNLIAQGKVKSNGVVVS